MVGASEYIDVGWENVASSLYCCGTFVEQSQHNRARICGTAIARTSVSNGRTVGHQGRAILVGSLVSGDGGGVVGCELFCSS